MSKTFPTNKDHLIDEMDEEYKLGLSDESYDQLRKLTDVQLILVSKLMGKAFLSGVSHE